MLRQKREQEEEMATNPVSFVKCELDATGNFNYPNLNGLIYLVFVCGTTLITLVRFAKLRRIRSHLRHTLTEGH